MNVKDKVLYTSKNGKLVKALIVSLGKGNSVQIEYGDQKKWVWQRSLTLLSARPTMQSVARDAGEIASPTDFKTVRHGRITAPNKLWREGRVWAMAHWKYQSLLLTDKGALFMVEGEVAFEVLPKDPAILQDIFDLHKRAEWWTR